MVFLEFTHVKKTLVLSETAVTIEKLNEIVDECVGPEENFYYIFNGKRLEASDIVHDGVIHAVPRLVGGKGGFGSMLRAIGAQIEKTTNREACRDLSGRRLRDINEEKRLKNWIAQQADREREAAEKRKKKLERLCAEPKHEFKDKEYEKQRSDLSEKVWDAVDQGIKASTSGCSASTTSQKRKLPEPKKPTKKSCLWVGDIDDISSCDSDDSEEDDTTTEKPLGQTVKASTEVEGAKESIKDDRETVDSPVETPTNTHESTEDLEKVNENSGVCEEESDQLEKGSGKVMKAVPKILET